MPLARPPRLGLTVSDHIARELDAFFASPTRAATTVTSSRESLPEEIAAALDEVLALDELSYRDGIIIQLAYGLKSPDTDLTRRPTGGRGVAGRLGTLFRSKHIRGVADAYQNIGKNTVELCRNNQPRFDSVLRWAQAASPNSRCVALAYMLASVALTARPVAPMPKLDRAALTFRRAASFLEALIATPSGGVHQQFAVAACLHAVIDEFAVPGLRVETKQISASDASVGTPGDIQVMRANRVEEAFEVTANPWHSKLDTALQVMRSADLPRVHVVASATAGFLDEMAATLDDDKDVSVIDVGALVSTLLALMRKPAREVALNRLYDYLDRYQPDIARVNAFVSLLNEHGLALDNGGATAATTHKL